MNEPDRELTSDEQHQIDLLVDGELGEVDRRLLLASFEAARRCAAARSVSRMQTWRIEARAPGRGAVDSCSADRLITATSSQGAGAVVQPVATQRWWTTGSGVSLAMAACFLVAFSLAWMIRSPGFASIQDSRVDAPGDCRCCLRGFTARLESPAMPRSLPVAGIR